MAWLNDSTEDGFEPVLAEDDWYDGPRSGLAVIGGVPHYFRCVDSYGDLDDYLVWPASAEVARWEREQWTIYVAWNDLYERGLAEVDSHPGRGGVDARYDELDRLLAPHRAVPDSARRVHADWRPLGRDRRYAEEGPGYEARWSRRET